MPGLPISLIRFFNIIIQARNNIGYTLDMSNLMVQCQTLMILYPAMQRPARFIKFIPCVPYR